VTEVAVLGLGLSVPIITVPGTVPDCGTVVVKPGSPGGKVVDLRLYLPIVLVNPVRLAGKVVNEVTVLGLGLTVLEPGVPTMTVAGTVPD
jgi:hypothetical protein